MCVCWLGLIGLCQGDEGEAEGDEPEVDFCGLCQVFFFLSLFCLIRVTSVLVVVIQLKFVKAAHIRVISAMVVAGR